MPRFAAWLPLAIVALCITACDSADANKEEEWITPQEALPEIERQVAVFLAEAEARGRMGGLYRPSELRIVVGKSLQRNGKDLCGFGEVDAATDQPTIHFEISKTCWDRTSWDREILVFHELGHALIGRGHRDDELPNGLRASIMNSGNIFGLYSETRAGHRAYYVDELFNASTPAPDWAY